MWLVWTSVGTTALSIYTCVQVIVIFKPDGYAATPADCLTILLPTVVFLTSVLLPFPLIRHHIAYPCMHYRK